MRPSLETQGGKKWLRARILGSLPPALTYKVPAVCSLWRSEPTSQLIMHLLLSIKKRCQALFQMLYKYKFVFNTPPLEARMLFASHILKRRTRIWIDGSLVVKSTGCSSGNQRLFSGTHIVAHDHQLLLQFLGNWCSLSASVSPRHAYGTLTYMQRNITHK